MAASGAESTTPILTREEYIEQAYFFRAFRERVSEGRPAQEILDHLSAELLATTKMPQAVQFMSAELKHSGSIGAALERLPHYFAPFQGFVLLKAEEDNIRFTFGQALLILEREANYKAGGATPAGLFVFELETLARNRLGYSQGLKCMERDGMFAGPWREFIKLVRAQLDVREFADFIFARSAHFVDQRRKADADYEPSFEVLFGAKEGMIAAANRGKDPTYLFSTLQRQLGFPEVPRPPRQDAFPQLFADVQRKLGIVEKKLHLLESQVQGNFDLSQHFVKPNPP